MSFKAGKSVVLPAIRRNKYLQNRDSFSSSANRVISSEFCHLNCTKQAHFNQQMTVFFPENRNIDSVRNNDLHSSFFALTSDFFEIRSLGLPIGARNELE
jgi:hypothetical protein